MTTMDTTNPLSAFSDEELVNYKAVRDRVKSGASLGDLPDNALIHYKRVRDTAGGKVPVATAQTAQPPEPSIPAQFSMPHEGVFPFPGGETPQELTDRRELLQRGYSGAFTAPVEDIQARVGRNMAPGPTAVGLPDGPIPGMDAKAIAAEEYEAQYPTPGGAAGRFLHGVVNAPMNLGGAIITGATGPIQAAARAAGMPDVASAVGRSVDQGRAVFEPRGTAGQLGNVVGNAAMLGVGSAAGVPAAASIGTFAAQGAGAGMEDYRRSVPPDQYDTPSAVAVGAMQGAVAGVGGVVGLGPILQRYGPAGAVGHVAGILRAAGVGAADNVAMQMVNNAIANTYTNRDLTEGTGEAALAGGIFGAAGHATAGGRPAPSTNRAQTPNTPESIGDNQPITTVSPDPARTYESDNQSEVVMAQRAVSGDTSGVSNDTNGVTSKESAQSEQIPRNTSPDPAERYSGEDTTTTTNPDDTGRVGPPPETVANPPGLPKGETVAVADGATATATPEPTEPGFWQSMRDRAQARINERTAAQREAESKFKGAGGRRGSGGSLDPQTIYDRAVILASHIGEAGVAGAKAIKAKAKELFGEAHPDVVRSAARLLRDSQGNDGQMDPARFEVAAAEAKGDMERAQRLEPNESADIREMMATRKGEADLKDAKTAFKEKMAAARAAAKAKREDAVATQKAAGDIATEKAETSADVRETMAKRAAEKAGKEKLSAAGEKAKAAMDAKREKFADMVDAMKAKEDLGQDIRKRLTELAKENLDPMDFRKVLPLIGRAKAKDPTAKNPSVVRDFYAGMTKIFDIADQSNLKSARAELRDTVGKAKAKSSGPTLASAINQALGVKGKPKEPYRTGRIGPREVAKLRPAYKDAAETLVDATRNDYVAGANKIADFIRAEEQAGRSNAFDDDAIDLLRGTEGKTTDELSANENRVVNEAIEHVAHLSDEANKAQVLGEKRDLDDLRKEVVQNVRDRWGVRESKNPGKSDIPGSHLAQLGKDFIVTDQDTLSTMVATVAGKDTAAHKVMWENIAKGESKQRTALRDLTEKTGLQDWSAADLARVNKPREVVYSGGKIKLRGWEMMEIVAAWGDPNSRAQLEEAGFVRDQDRSRSDKKLFFTDRDITAIEAAMTAKERGAIDPMRAAMKEGFDAANDAHERMHGFRMPDNANHWSRTRDLAATERTVSGTLDQKAKQNHWYEDAGIFKDRSSSKAAIVIRNPFEWVPAQLHTLTGMAHLAEPVRAARRVMADPAVKNEFHAKGGDSFVKRFEERLASVAGLPSEDSTVNRIGQQFLGLRARSKLAFRISSVVKQKLGFLQAMAAVTDGGLRARMMKQAVNPINLFTAERTRIRAEINPRSGYLADRADPAYAASVASAANPDLRTSSSAVVRGYQAVERAGLAPLQFADGDVVIGVYKAVKGHYEAQGLTGDALLDKATWETEKIIRESQNPTSAIDMSGFHLTGRRNSLVGMMTLFTSSSNKVRNQMRVAASNYAADPSPANRRQLAQVTALTAANAVTSKVMSKVFSGKTLAVAIASVTGAYLKEDKKDTLGNDALDVLADLADTAGPFVGDAVRAFSTRGFGSGTWIKNVIDATSGVFKQAEKDDSFFTPEVAKKAIRMLRAGEVLPDAPLDYTGQAVRGVAGD